MIFVIIYYLRSLSSYLKGFSWAMQANGNNTPKKFAGIWDKQVTTPEPKDTNQIVVQKRILHMGIFYCQDLNYKKKSIKMNLII